MLTDLPDKLSETIGSCSIPEEQFKKLVEIISRSQHSYRELIDNLDQAVFTLSIDGEVRVANRRLCQILGVAFPDLIGHRLSEFVDSPTLSDVQRSLVGFDSNGSWSGTIPVRFKGDSSLRYFDCWIQALADEGETVSVSGWARDVTSHYETEIRFNELFESLREGVFFATLSGQLLDANPAMVRLLAYEGKRDLQAHNLQEFYRNPAERDAIVQELESKGSFRDREIELRRKDGQLICCLASGFAVRDTFGRVTRLQGTLVDITERRAMEKKLHQEQEFVRRLVANFPDLIAVFDREGRFTYVSQSVKDVLGGTPEEYVGDTLGSRASREDQGKLAEMFQKVISGYEPGAQVEIRTRHTDGSWKILRASAGPLFDEAGKITGIVASARDVTESKRIEQRLVQREKFAAMGQMMAGAAHELNNPLTAILGVGELLHERASDETTKRHLDLVMQQARRAASIVQSLLAFSRPAAQTRSNLRPEEIVQQALRLAQPALSQNNIAMTFEAPGNLPSILGDAKLLVQAVLNIIVNAEQSISSRGTAGNVKVSLGSAEGRITLTIVDDGPGIAIADIGKIFDPFFTTKRPGGGTGLGLTTALAVVKEHGGTIDVESTPGTGAAFQVILPVADEPAVQRAPSPITSAASVNSDSLSGHSALIVDDEEGIREILQEGLAARGMKTESVGTAEQALALLENNSYDVVLCDFNLPKLSGEQFFDEIHKRSERSLPRFVFITGELVDSTRVAEVGKKGAFILQKPFRLPDVVKLLAGLIQPQPSKIG
jgi:PAS domain S-box-containing protein